MDGTNEDEIVFDPEMLAQLHPRRGGVPVEPPASAPNPNRAKLGRVDEQRVEELVLAGNDPILIAVLQSNVQSPQRAGLFGAVDAFYGHPAHTLGIADRWVADHGLVFAVESLLEASAIFVHDHTWGRPIDSPAVRTMTNADDRIPKAMVAFRWWAIAKRLRHHIVAADQNEFDQVVTALQHYRNGLIRQRLLCSYLAPSRTDWVDQDLQSGRWAWNSGWMLIDAVDTVEQLRQCPVDLGYEPITESELVTLLDGIGPGLDVVITEWLHQQYISAGAVANLCRTLAMIPTDSAFGELLRQPADPTIDLCVFAAGVRFPRRALAMLTTDYERYGSASACDRLRLHILSHPGLPGAEALGQQHGWLPRVPSATQDELPPVLAAPPWLTGKPVKRTVLKDLAPPPINELVWLPGEQDEWTEHNPPSHHDWADEAAQQQRGVLAEYYRQTFFTHAPDDLTLPLFADWDGRGSFFINFEPVVARYGINALPHALNVARSSPARQAHLLLPFVNLEIAEQMAHWLEYSRTAKITAQQWLNRHAVAAVQLLLPAALGRPGRNQRAAETALRHIDRQTVVETAQETGVLTQLTDLFDADPMRSFPSRMPTPPAWFNAHALPQILLRGSNPDQAPAALPAASAAILVQMLLISKPDQVYPGIPQVKAAVTESSLADFVWELYRQANMRDPGAGSGWALDALGMLGNDDTVRNIVPFLTEWPPMQKTARAIRALDVLVGVGTDLAFRELQRVARSNRRTMSVPAVEKIARLAESLGFTPDQMADRLIDDLGLTRSGRLTLDYGSRVFFVGIDEDLNPILTDSNGQPRKTLPPVGGSEDPDRATAAKAEFTQFKKKLRAVVKEQTARLEESMTQQRTWSVADFENLFLRHPILRRFASRMVWRAENGAFRVAEDGTLADANDRTFVMNGDITIAHPLTLGVEITSWTTMFSDYEILQPFPQLGRETFPASAAAGFGGRTFDTGKVLALERRGWLRTSAADGAIQTALTKELGGGRSVRLDLEPGIRVVDVLEFPEQKLGLPDLTDLDLISVSEIVRDLQSLL